MGSFRKRVTFHVRLSAADWWLPIPKPVRVRFPAAALPVPGSMPKPREASARLAESGGVREQTMPTKQLKRYAVIDWNAETVSMRKTKPSESEISPTELVSVHRYEVAVPEIEIPEVAAEFDVSQANVERATYELLDLGEEEPGWVEIAESELDLFPPDELRDGGRNALINTLLGSVLRQYDGYAETEEVEAYLNDRIEYYIEQAERREASSR